MSTESASGRQQRWAFVVRRSFGIPDPVADKDAREALIGFFENRLQENGWQSPTRGTAEPIVDALMALGASGDLDDTLLPPGLAPSTAAFTTREAAYRLLDKGMTVVDSEHLVFDARSEYPPEVVAVAQQVLDRIGHYVREQPFDD